MPKKPLTVPDLPIEPNASAFLARGAATGSARKKQKAPDDDGVYQVQILLPRRWKQRLREKLARDGKNLQDIGRAAFEAYFNS